MLSERAEALTLLKAALEHLEEGAPVLASSDDCDYFRKHYAPAKIVPQKAEPLPKPAPIEKIEIPTPVIKAEPAPIEKAEVQLPAVKTEPAPVEKFETPPRAVKAEPAPKIEKAPKVETAPISQPAENFGELRKIWPKIAPGVPLLEEIPNDEMAKKVANRWKAKNATAEISILAYHEPPAQRALLEQIAKAIDAVYGPAKIVQSEPIEKEKQWEAFLSVPHLKLAIACDYTLWQLGGLMQHYREVPAQGTRHLGKVPVFLLPDLSLYLKDPLLKRSLWKALGTVCQKLS
ncbi:MAG: hypothetical protein JSS32_06610 [Verrucomicrobia bacterium]|nr:hypothetical protein [Verrucomicrobiota bacterium]